MVVALDGLLVDCDLVDVVTLPKAKLTVGFLVVDMIRTGTKMAMYL